MTNYARLQAPELEEIANQNWNNKKILKEIQEALSDRSTKWSKRLRKKITDRLLQLENGDHLKSISKFRCIAKYRRRSIPSLDLDP